MSAPLRIAWCWSGVSGYMAASWRAVARHSEVALRVLVTPSSQPWDAGIADGIADYHTVPAEADHETVARLVLEHQPDVLILCGWMDRRYLRLVRDRRFAHIKKIMAMDTPWRGTCRQHAAPLLLRPWLSRIDAVVVAGDAAGHYAQRLGFGSSRIFRGMYGFEFQTFAAAAAGRSQLPAWPRRFLFVGRYVPEKGLDVLLDAYTRYRQSVRNPWPLSCCGTGRLAGLTDSVAGVENLGFVQPAALARVMAGHGTLVLPSRFEPWGVVLAEALASQMPVVCTNRCGAASDLVRPYYNGLVVPPDDAAGLARSLSWIHQHEDRLPEMGQRGQYLAEAYSAEAFADRWIGYMTEVCSATPA